MGRGKALSDVEVLAALLEPYAVSAPELAGAERVVDVPPAVALPALKHLPADMRDARPNSTQPAMTWLATLAAELDGPLVGSPIPGRVLVRFDGIQLDHERARALAGRIDAAMPTALEAAVAEAWSSWGENKPLWTGVGTDLLDGELPAGALVAGLWWD